MWLVIGLLLLAVLVAPVSKAGLVPWRSRAQVGVGGPIGGVLRRLPDRPGSSRETESWVADLADLCAICLDAGMPLADAVATAVDAVAEVPAGAAALLRGAVANHVGEQGGSLGSAAEETGGGKDADDLRVVLACWELSAGHGVPVAAATRAAARAVRVRGAARRDAATLAAGPRASMLLLTALPLAGPLAAVLLGISPGELYSSALPALSGVVGVALAALGWLWSRRILRAGLREKQVPLARGGSAPVSDVAVAVALLGLTVRSGRGLVGSLEAVASIRSLTAGADLATVGAALRWGADEAEAWAHVDPCWAAVAQVWGVAQRVGAAPADLLLAAAERVSSAEGARVARSVQRSGVWLVLPLGVCFLPAFILTTIVPVVLLVGQQLLLP